MEQFTKGNAQRHFYIEIFNKRAIESDWPVLCDDACRFSEKKLTGASALWQLKAQEAGHTPLRKDMTVRLLQPYIPRLSIFERVPDGGGAMRYRVRLMGTNVVTYTKEMTGHFLDEVIEPPFLPAWYAVGETIFQYGGPLRILNRGDTFRKKYLVGESFAAPLLTNDGRADLIMSVTSYEGFAPWDAVYSRAKQQLGL